MKAMTFEATINTSFGQLEETGVAAHGFLAANLVSPEVSYKIELALEEMVTNIIKYGYDKPSEENTAHIRIEINSSSVVMTLIDSGHEFNPLKMQAPDTSKDLNSRPIGGVGIHLTRNMTSKMEYRREKEKNILEITVNN